MSQSAPPRCPCSFGSPAVPSRPHHPGARPDLTPPTLVVVGAGRHFLIIQAVFGCEVKGRLGD